MEYSSIRLNFSQAFNGIGKVVGPLIASATFFNASNGDSLASVQWVPSHSVNCLILTGLLGRHGICMELGGGFLFLTDSRDLG